MLNFVKQIVFAVIQNGRQIHNLRAIFKIRFIGYEALKIYHESKNCSYDINLMQFLA